MSRSGVKQSIGRNTVDENSTCYYSFIVAGISWNNRIRSSLPSIIVSRDSYWYRICSRHLRTFSLEMTALAASKTNISPAFSEMHLSTRGTRWYWLPFFHFLLLVTEILFLGLAHSSLVMILPLSFLIPSSVLHILFYHYCSIQNISI